MYKKCPMSEHLLRLFKFFSINVNFRIIIIVIIKTYLSQLLEIRYMMSFILYACSNLNVTDPGDIIVTKPSNVNIS